MEATVINILEEDKIEIKFKEDHLEKNIKKDSVYIINSILCIEK